MNRNRKVASVVFVGAALVVLSAPSAESEALAGPGSARAEEAVTTPLAAVAAKVEQLPSNAGLKATATQELGAGGTCPDGMLEVEGDYCPTLEQKCIRWKDPETTIPRRCDEFAPTGACQGKTAKKHFCIDRFEWPNKAGEKPVVMKSWYTAADSCKAVGKRLCGESEWTLACEGQERLPYPYGYQRNAEACNIDKPHPDVNERALANPDPKVRNAEIDRLWQGEVSGSRESCVSPYGVMDMTGNVDEWVVNESGVPYKSGLKGGYWGPVRDRCRPMTTAHGEQFEFYQIGFRCCADAPAAPAGVKPSAPAGGSAPANKIPSTNPAPGALVGS